MAVTHNDKDKVLFQSMIAMIEYLDEQTNDKQFYFGTDRFEYVWEKLIDTVFCIPDKTDYFLRTKWTLRHGDQRNNYALEPDTIMLHGDKIYVLDAKYYRYGITGQPKHLPESTSINTVRRPSLPKPSPLTFRWNWRKRRSMPMTVLRRS